MKTLVAGSVLALASAASADVVVTLTSLSANGFQFFSLGSIGAFTGTLTGVSVDATLEASAGFTYADDLTLYVTPSNDLLFGGTLQVGGFSSLSAANRFSWANGGSELPGTVVQDSIDLSALSIDSASHAFWIGNGYGFTGASGTWSGTLTLHGIDAVPAPGALAVLGLAGLATRSRRRLRA